MNSKGFPYVSSYQSYFSYEANLNLYDPIISDSNRYHYQHEFKDWRNRGDEGEEEGREENDKYNSVYMVYNK